MKTKEEIIQALRGVKIITENLDKTVASVWIQHTIDYLESQASEFPINEERMIALCSLCAHCEITTSKTSGEWGQNVWIRHYCKIKQIKVSHSDGCVKYEFKKQTK